MTKDVDNVIFFHWPVGNLDTGGVAILAAV